MRWLALAVVCVGCGRVDFGIAGDAGATLDPDLVAWYPMDETTVTRAADATGHGHDATCTGACPAPGVGIRGGAFVFDGGGEPLQVIDDGSFNLPQGTIATWLRVDGPPTTDDYADAFEKASNNAGDSSYEGVITENPDLTFAVGGDSLDCEPYATTTWPALGAWHHIAMVWDSTTVTLYVDGTVADSEPFELGYSSNALILGANFDSAGVGLAGFLVGALDDFRVYSRQLTAAELQPLAAR